MVTVLAPDPRRSRAGISPGPAREQMRARYPDRSGFVTRDGVRTYFEVYGQGEPTIVFAPTWTIVTSRIWKLQIPYFARQRRVVTFDPRGNGRSDRPSSAAAYTEHEFATDLIAVMDEVGVERAVLVSLSAGAQRSLIAAVECPDRIAGLVFIGPAVPLGQPLPERDVDFDVDHEKDDGWTRYNRHSWRRDYHGFLEFFFERCFTEPHSTKQIEDAVGWGSETDAETLILTHDRPALDEGAFRALCQRVRCPTIVIQGLDDAITGPGRGVALAEAIEGARLVTIEGGGHINNSRDPVLVNLLIRDFVRQMPVQSAATRTWTRSLSRQRRALYISSPIGLGHAQRDVSIADELRKLHPDLEIDWLAQHPVTAVLEEHGERIHPLSAELASESAHITAESSEHDLNAFQAIRRMDEILVNNFMVFHDAIETGEYDLVIGDEAWDVDYYLHENPELKRTAFAWMTDFVGWLPMTAGGDREAFLTADYNAEMIEQVERFPRIRDRAIFVGDPDEIVPDDFGPDLPAIREWTERHYAFSGYVTGFDPTPMIEGREALRAELGYRPDERVVIVTVGGSGVGESLLRRVVASYPDAARRVNGLRMIAVAGPRIDPASLGAAAGVEVRAFVPDLYKHLAASDLAVVQGGLTTTMELTAARRPFLYFPLRNHFEQNRHVRHRLERYGAGSFMDYDASPPEIIAEAIAAEIDRPVAYLPVAPDGAARAAGLIAEVL
jgi:pimeloyl-ACP methyl ester carboxylesterase